MGYVKRSLGGSEHAAIYEHADTCNWPKCYATARWDVEPRAHLLGRGLPAGSYCTAHAQRAIKRIERAAQQD